MIRHHAHARTGLALAGLAVLALAAGCSDDNKLTVPSMTLPGGVTVPAGNNDLPDGSLDLGSCHVKVTGDVNAEWTAPGGASAMGYGPWVPQVPGVTMPIDMDEGFFILNCQGDGENYVGFMPMADGEIPMAPGTYTIEPAGNAFGTSETGQMTTLLGLDGTETNWGPSEPGTLVITEFDADHIAGTFRLTVTDVLAKLNGSSKGNAVITGEFEYSNPN